MVSKILDGKALAKLAEEDIKTNVSRLKEKGITPTLATILVGLAIGKYYQHLVVSWIL